MRIVSAALIILAIVIGVGGFIASMGADEAQLPADTKYDDVHDATTETVITVLHVIGGIASIVGVAVLLIAFSYLSSQVKQ